MQAMKFGDSKRGLWSGEMNNDQVATRCPAAGDNDHRLSKAPRNILPILHEHASLLSALTI